MDTNLKTIAKIAAFAGAFALTGCARLPMTVHSHYEPPANVAKVPGADKVVVNVIVKNEKKHGEKINVSKNGYNMPLAGVYMHIDKDFKQAIDKALVARGFKVGNNGSINVSVIVKTFFLKETSDFSGVTNKGNLNMLVSINNNTGNSIYHKNITVNNYVQKTGVFAFTLGRSVSANELLSIGVNKLANNEQFIHALIAASIHQTNG